MHWLITRLLKNLILVYFINNLGENFLGCGGIRDLISNLGKNATLENLDIGSNFMENSGMNEVAKLIKANKSIKTLNLG